MNTNFFMNTKSNLAAQCQKIEDYKEKYGIDKLYTEEQLHYFTNSVMNGWDCGLTHSINMTPENIEFFKDKMMSEVKDTLPNIVESVYGFIIFGDINRRYFLSLDKNKHNEVYLLNDKAYIKYMTIQLIYAVQVLMPYLSIDREYNGRIFDYIQGKTLHCNIINVKTHSAR